MKTKAEGGGKGARKSDAPERCLPHFRLLSYYHFTQTKRTFQDILVQSF